MKNEKKREFKYPEAIIVEFDDKDVIATSGPGEGPDKPSDDWHGWW